MMGAHQLFFGELVELVRETFAEPAAVDEDDRGTVAADCVQQFGVDRRPDAAFGLWCADLTRIQCAEDRAAGRWLHSAVRRVLHIRHRHANAKVHDRCGRAVDDVDVAIAAEETGDGNKRPHRCREADSLRLLFGQLGEAFERQCEMGATLGGGERMDFVDDDFRL